ncbi:MAG: toll/interleukin-1 receptor domain-containing protein [Deferribacteres bacterium]|nr:toll/interleukin-1 receptor domain-containing protein [candidate division KSB1 bacterium]MCB9510332.1 toll/interleukin-1 receptor domain-containing protein [Deferribacteres bacterium]
MPFVFISHATHADGALAARLANDLQAHGVRYWKAPESIQPGERWAEAIETALETCDTMVVLLTPDALTSRWVKTETSVAIEREHQGKMTFIPLDVKQCDVPLLVKNYQMIPFRSDYNAGLRALLRRLGVSIKKQPAAPQQAKYDFSGIFGKTGDQQAYQKWLKTFSATPPKPEPKNAPPKTASEQKPASIYDFLKKQPSLLGNIASTPATPKKPQDAASKGDKNKPFLFSGGGLGNFPTNSPASNTLMTLALDYAARGDKEKNVRHFEKAIGHYTNAIAVYPIWKHLALKFDFLLGSIYYRRAECYMGIDFNKMIERFNKPIVGGQTRLTGFASLGTTSAMFGSGLLFQSEEYKKAQADFQKAKELGYSPPKKDT